MTDFPTYRSQVLDYVQDNYGTVPEYPWERTPDAAVLRQKGNAKWYGLIMRIPAQKLGIPTDAMTDILNVKCSPLEIGSLLQKPGIFPAYHMNKTHWISILLDGPVPEAELFFLLDQSFARTKPTPKSQKKEEHA